MIGLIIWNIILTLALALGALVTLGKFSRIKRDQQETVNVVFEEIQPMGEDLGKLKTDFNNLVTKVKTLEENHTYDNATLAGSMEQIENRIGQIYETEEGLRQDINLLLSADKEHPVLAPVTLNKGGRPRKGEV